MREYRKKEKIVSLMGKVGYWTNRWSCLLHKAIKIFNKCRDKNDIFLVKRTFANNAYLGMKPLDTELKYYIQAITKHSLNLGES